MPRRSKQNKNVRKVGGRKVLRSKLREVGEKKVKLVVRYLLGSLIVFLLSLAFFFVAGIFYGYNFYRVGLLFSSLGLIFFMPSLFILILGFVFDVINAIRLIFGLAGVVFAAISVFYGVRKVMRKVSRVI